MILPITCYGCSVLKKRAEPLPFRSPELPELIENMFQTMYNAHGVGLAAPQVDRPYRLFIVDGDPMTNLEKGEDLSDFKKIFVNPVIVQETGEKWGFEEGCLSIPGIRETVYRPSEVLIEYYDENWAFHRESFKGMRARIIQHEYDHIEGILFIDRLPTIRKQFLRPKLVKLMRGVLKPEYPMLLQQRASTVLKRI
jgi:peptide deformylase